MRTIFKYGSVATGTTGAIFGTFINPSRNRIRAVTLQVSPAGNLAASQYAQLWVTVGNPDLTINVDERPNAVAYLNANWQFATAVGITQEVQGMSFLGLDFDVAPNDRVYCIAYVSGAVNMLCHAQLLLAN